MSVDSPYERPNLDDAPELLTVTQAAFYLGLGKSTLYRKIADGRLPVTLLQTFGGQRISRRQLLQWLDQPVEHKKAARADAYREISARLDRR